MVCNHIRGRSFRRLAWAPMQAKNPIIPIINPRIKAKVSPKSKPVDAAAKSNVEKIARM